MSQANGMGSNGLTIVQTGILKYKNEGQSHSENFKTVSEKIGPTWKSRNFEGEELAALSVNPHFDSRTPEARAKMEENQHKDLKWYSRLAVEHEDDGPCEDVYEGGICGEIYDKEGKF